jgi:hypothetical protein
VPGNIHHRRRVGRWLRRRAPDQVDHHREAFYLARTEVTPTSSAARDGPGE